MDSNKRIEVSEELYSKATIATQKYLERHNPDKNIMVSVQNAYLDGFIQGYKESNND